MTYFPKNFSKLLQKKIERNKKLVFLFENFQNNHILSVKVLIAKKSHQISYLARLSFGWDPWQPLNIIKRTSQPAKPTTSISFDNFPYRYSLYLLHMMFTDKTQCCGSGTGPGSA